MPHRFTYRSHLRIQPWLFHIMPCKSNAIFMAPFTYPVAKILCKQLRCMHKESVTIRIWFIITFIPNHFWHMRNYIIPKTLFKRRTECLRPRIYGVLSVASGCLKRHNIITRFVCKNCRYGFTKLLSQFAFIRLMRYLDKLFHRITVHCIEICETVEYSRFFCEKCICIPLFSERFFLLGDHLICFDFSVSVKQNIIGRKKFRIPFVTLMFTHHFVWIGTRQHNHLLSKFFILCYITTRSSARPAVFVVQI